jgi:hypothetical protein
LGNNHPPRHYGAVTGGSVFTSLGLRPGKYGIFLQNREGKSEFYNDPTPVEVIESDVAGIEVRAKRGATISGTVIIEGTSDPAMLAKRSQITLNANFEPTDRPPQPVAWDAAERAKLRRDAEAAKNEVELLPCQRVKDHVLRF